MATFTITKGKTASEFTEEGGVWNPHAHFTGETDDAEKVAAVQKVIDRHMGGIVAFHEYRPFPFMYSLEIQFENEEQGRLCREEYSRLWTPGGKLRKRKGK